jgi:hypothetical protein
MERSAVIAGIGVVGLLAIFTAGFVMIGFGGNTGGDIPEVDREQRRVAIDARDEDGKTVTKLGDGVDADAAEDDKPLPVVDEKGVVRQPNPDGMGAEFWAEERKVRGEQLRTRARGVVKAFVMDLDPADGAQLESAMEELFAESSRIQNGIQDGSITPAQGREQMGVLRKDSIQEIGDLLGGADFARFRMELRRADAAVF